MAATGDQQQRPEKAAGIALVFLGAFNPAIFQPAWFMRYGLVPDEEDAVEVDAITPQITSFTLDWLRVIVQPERCELQATDEVPSYKALHDLADGTFDLLSHTPVTALGINRFVHFEMENEKAWHNLGLQLFTHDPWEGVLDDPRMRTLQVEDAHGARENPERVTTVTVQPSAVFKRAVFVATNDHFNIDKEAVDPTGATEKLDEMFDEVLESAGNVIERVRGL